MFRNVRCFSGTAAGSPIAPNIERSHDAEGPAEADRRRDQGPAAVALPVQLGRRRAAGVRNFTLQLVLDEGAWEEVVSVTAEDAEVLQGLLARAGTVYYDIERRTLMFGTRPPGG